MRFKTFLEDEEQETSLVETVATIRKECARFLEESKGKLLFRGIFGLPKIRFTAHPTNRKPKDSHGLKHFNIVFNTGIEEAFGIQSVRTHTIFASGRDAQAIIYGELSVIFPKGNFRFLSSTEISDSYERNARFVRAVATRANLSASILIDGLVELSKTYGSISDVDANDLAAAFHTTADPQEFKTKLLNSFGNTFRELYEDTTDLSGFIEIGHEILIYESEGYYSIPVSAFANEMRNRGIEFGGFSDGNTDVYDFIKAYIAGEDDAF